MRSLLFGNNITSMMALLETATEESPKSRQHNVDSVE